MKMSHSSRLPGHEGTGGGKKTTTQSFTWSGLNEDVPDTRTRKTNRINCSGEEIEKERRGERGRGSEGEGEGEDEMKERGRHGDT